MMNTLPHEITRMILDYCCLAPGKNTNIKLVCQDWNETVVWLEFDVYESIVRQSITKLELANDSRGLHILSSLINYFAHNPSRVDNFAQVVFTTRYMSRISALERMLDSEQDAGDTGDAIVAEKKAELIAKIDDFDNSDVLKKFVECIDDISYDADDEHQLYLGRYTMVVHYDPSGWGFWFYEGPDEICGFLLGNPINWAKYVKMFELLRIPFIELDMFEKFVSLFQENESG